MNAEKQVIIKEIVIKESEGALMIFYMTFVSYDDKDKFEYLYTKYKKLLLYKAYEILKDYSLAEDATSEAFIRIYKNLHKIDDVNSNQTISFLVIIVKNISLTFLKKEKRNATEIFDDDLQDATNLEDYILSEITSENIYQLMNQLTEDLKSVFILKFAHNLSNKEIAKALHIKESNVGVKLFRAKEKLSKILIKEGYVHEKAR